MLGGKFISQAWKYETKVCDTWVHVRIEAKVKTEMRVVQRFSALKKKLSRQKWKMAKPYKRAFTLIIVTRKPPTSVSNETSLRQVFFACDFPVFGNAFVRGMGTNTRGSDLRGTLPSPAKYTVCCSQSRWRKRTERLYWSWWNSLRIIHVQIAELPVRAWNLVFHRGLHIGALWFVFWIFNWFCSRLPVL